MIGAVFEFGNAIVEVRIQGTSLYFRSSEFGNQFGTIESLKLSKAGVIKQFPDLENDKEWREKSIERLKDHIKKLKNEKARMNYVIQDLSKHGYTPKFIQRQGFRPEKIRWEKS